MESPRHKPSQIVSFKGIFRFMSNTRKGMCSIANRNPVSSQTDLRPYRPQERREEQNMRIHMRDPESNACIRMINMFRFCFIFSTYSLKQKIPALEIPEGVTKGLKQASAFQTTATRRLAVSWLSVCRSSDSEWTSRAAGRGEYNCIYIGCVFVILLFCSPDLFGFLIYLFFDFRPGQ